MRHLHRARNLAKLGGARMLSLVALVAIASFTLVELLEQIILPALLPLPS